MAALLKINTEGRLRFVEGDDQEILPGIRAYTGGRHTWASQFVSATVAGGTAVFTSDNVYLYENLEKRAAIAQTLDAASNLKAQDRVRALASDAAPDRPRPRSRGVRAVRASRRRDRADQVTRRCLSLSQELRDGTRRELRTISPDLLQTSRPLLQLQIQRPRLSLAEREAGGLHAQLLEKLGIHPFRAADARQGNRQVVLRRKAACLETPLLRRPRHDNKARTIDPPGGIRREDHDRIVGNRALIVRDTARQA